MSQIKIKPIQIKNKSIHMNNKKIIEKTWVNGGKFAYSDNPFKEALYALEDELICLDGVDGKFIPHYKMIRVMRAYEKFIKKHFTNALSQQKEEFKKITNEDFVIFRRPLSCVKDFLAQDCDGLYHKLQEINPEDILKAIQKL